MTRPTGPEHIFQVGLGFWAAKTLLSGVELGVFSALADGPRSLPALRDELGLHDRGARDFLDALVSLGLLDREGDDYRNTESTGLFLDRAKPTYIGGLLEMANARLYPYWGHLTEALRTGLPQNEARTGGDLFTALTAEPERLAGFLRAMTAGNMGAAQALAERFPWADYSTFVDIGTAEGGLPVQLARSHPQLTGGGFDLPPVGPYFDAHVTAAGLTDRLVIHPGDFWEDELPGADVLVLGHVLHDWGLDEKMALLRAAHRALPPGGALIIYDAMIDDARRIHSYGLLMSLNMLIETSAGYDYTAADCISWLDKVGFTSPQVSPLFGPDSMVVARK
jgi:hypothetical protein